MNPRQNPRQEPTPAPSTAEFIQATKIIDRLNLHYFQVLYFKGLTSPGKEGYPFHAKIHPEHGHCLQVKCQLAEEYNFNILITSITDQDEIDRKIIDRCKTIQEAIRNGDHKKDKSFGKCCSFAQQENCVCVAAWNCELHGNKHVGSHD